jgi:hypothetical protein
MPGRLHGCSQAASAASPLETLQRRRRDVAASLVYLLTAPLPFACIIHHVSYVAHIIHDTAAETLQRRCSQPCLSAPRCTLQPDSFCRVSTGSVYGVCSVSNSVHPFRIRGGGGGGGGGGGSRGPDSSSYLMPKTGTQSRLDRRDRSRHDDPADPDPAPAPAAAAGAAAAGKDGKDGVGVGKKGALEGSKHLEMLSSLETSLCIAVRHAVASAVVCVRERE